MKLKDAISLACKKYKYPEPMKNAEPWEVHLAKQHKPPKSARKAAARARAQQVPQVLAYGPPDHRIFA